VSPWFQKLLAGFSPMPCLPSPSGCGRSRPPPKRVWIWLWFGFWFWVSRFLQVWSSGWWWVVRFECGSSCSGFEQVDDEVRGWIQCGDCVRWEQAWDRALCCRGVAQWGASHS